MSFNKFKKRKNNFNNLIKRILFGKGPKVKSIILGKASGIKMYIDPAYKFQRIIGADEREIQPLFVHFSKKSKLFFDIGASDGYYSLLYKKYNPAGEIFLFDTDKKFESIQKTHFELNDIFSGYQSFNKPVSDKNDEQQISLDSFEIKHKKIFIKIDVEGGEIMVLRGMKSLLTNNDCCLIIETHSAQSEKDCIDLLNSHTYLTRVIKNAWWRFMLAERRPLEHNRWLAAWRGKL